MLARQRGSGCVAGGRSSAPRQQLQQLQHSRRTISQRRRGLVVRAAAASTAAQPTEAAAIAAYKASVGGADSLAPCEALLRRAAADKSVAPELVEGALAFLEGSHAAPGADVAGVWRLVFSTSTSARWAQYIPVQEDFVIKPAERYCALESVVGPFQFVISGSIREWRPAPGELEFQFTAVDILLLGNKIWRVNPSTKPKTYTFYFVSQDGAIAAARSSAGGLALLRK